MFPRTATKPILMEEYLERNRRSYLVDYDRLTPEWRSWYESMRRKDRYKP